KVALGCRTQEIVKLVYVSMEKAVRYCQTNNSSAGNVLACANLLHDIFIAVVLFWCFLYISCISHIESWVYSLELFPIRNSSLLAPVHFVTSNS
ncbi:hypothetical protein KI387_002046, partial [Taxus chinensis]